MVEQVDRISRLNSQDWELLKSQITNKGIIIVALDLPPLISLSIPEEMNLRSVCSPLLTV